MGEPTFFIDDTAVTAREAEVTAADFNGGANLAGSCACGVGINMNEGAVVGTPEQFTLLDQHGGARAAQISQHIGGSGLGAGAIGTLPEAVIQFGNASANGDGQITTLGNSTLSVLADGWEVNA